MKASDLPSILSKTNFRFFELLIEQPLSVRELAEKAKCSPAKASQAVKQFRKKQLIVVKKQKNKKVIILNKNNALVRLIISLIFIDRIMASQAFQDLKKKAKTIGVYGSVVEGTMDKLSDIDLWILTEKKLSLLEQERISNKLTNELNREVSLKAFTKESWQKLKQKDKIFFDELNYKSKILHGEMIA